MCSIWWRYLLQQTQRSSFNHDHLCVTAAASRNRYPSFSASCWWTGFFASREWHLTSSRQAWWYCTWGRPHESFCGTAVRRGSSCWQPGSVPPPLCRYPAFFLSAWYRRGVQSRHDPPPPCPGQFPPHSFRQGGVTLHPSLHPYSDGGVVWT